MRVEEKELTVDSIDNIPHQQNLINDVLNEGKFMIIVLDACRYDFMVNWTKEFDQEMEVDMVESGVPNTHTWMRERWDGEYDLVYIGPIPYISNQPVESPSGGKTYNGADHFTKVVEAWRDYWDNDLGCVTPENCCKAVLDNMHDRMVVHFGQPHMPHIGDPSMINNRIESDNLSQVGESNEFSDEYIRESYYGNLKYVMENGVKKLVLLDGGNDRRVVITSDHGESLGEEDRYGHNNHSPEVTLVPWVDIE